MKRDQLFEVLEPPPHGLTRLRAQLAARRARCWKGALALSAAATLVVVLLTPRPHANPFERDARAALDALRADGPGLEARGSTGVQALPSSTPRVMLWRVTAVDEADPAP